MDNYNYEINLRFGTVSRFSDHTAIYINGIYTFAGDSTTNADIVQVSRFNVYIGNKKQIELKLANHSLYAFTLTAYFYRRIGTNN